MSTNAKDGFIKYIKEDFGLLQFERVEGTNIFERMLNQTVIQLSFEKNPTRRKSTFFEVDEIFEANPRVTVVPADPRGDLVIFNTDEILDDKGCRDCVKKVIEYLNEVRFHPEIINL